MSEAPQMSPYARHVLICTGQYCDPERKSPGVYRRFGEMLGELADYDNPERVKRGVVACLGVCAGGPLMVVYPEGVWYHHVDEALLRRIVEEHLRENQPVTEAIFHQLED